MTNNGTATIVSVTVTDTISPVVTSATTQAPSAFAGPAVASVASGTRFVWSASSLAFTQGQTYSFTITGVIGTVGATTQVSNTAYASASSMCSLARMQTNSVGVLVTNGTPPGAPASLTSRGQNEQVYLNWSPATPGTYPVTSYSIYRATCSGCPSSLLVSVSSATTEYTNTGLANGTTYEYKVQAVDTSFNAGPFSSTATGTPLDANLNPPTCLTAIQLGASNRVMISWCFSPPATHPATGYGIYRTTFAGFDITPGAVAVVDAGTSLFTDTLLTTGTFWYHVRGIGSISDPSPLSSPFVIDANPPSTPPGAFAETRGGRITLTWDESLPGAGSPYWVSGYVVYRATFPIVAGVPPYATVYGQSWTRFDDPGAAANTRYYYTVNAFDSRSPAHNESGGSVLANAACYAMSYSASKQQLPGAPGVGEGVLYRLIVANTGSASRLTSSGRT